MTSLDTPSKSAGATNSAGARDSGSGVAKPATKRMRKRKMRLYVAGVILVGAFAFLLIEGLTNSLNYFETVNQAVSQRAMLGTSTFRLEGDVVPGSIHPTTTGVNFSVESNGVRLAVIETGQPPQLFQNDIPVVLVGHFAGSGFSSDQIIVDHSSQYIAEYPKRVKAPNGSVH